MTVKVRPYKRGGWEIDIMLTIPGRPRIRERKKAPMRNKSDARRWGEERERQLIQHYTSFGTTEDEPDERPDLVKKEVPTLAQFAPRYIEGYCKANRLRPASIHNREKYLRNHLIPAFGRKRLHRISPEDIQRFKAERAHLKHSTINGMLTILRAMLSVAVEWKVIEVMPLKIKKLKESKPDIRFYDFEELDRLVLAAESLDDPNALLMILLAAEAGLRSGELAALPWSDVDLKLGILNVTRATWRGHEGPPKGGRSRSVPLAPRLAEALTAHRHLRGPNVLWATSNKPANDGIIRHWLNRAQTKAELDHTGPHCLRHTFCSHLAMLGKPVRAIQMLAGHRSIVTTERYMHLAPSVTRDAIDGLRRPSNWRHVGDTLSTVIHPQQFQ